MLTAEENGQAKTIQDRLAALDAERGSLQAQIIALRERCDHPKLPIRELGEEYRDFCPDCGFVTYCYITGTRK